MFEVLPFSLTVPTKHSILLNWLLLASRLRGLRLLQKEMEQAELVFFFLLYLLRLLAGKAIFAAL